MIFSDAFIILILLPKMYAPNYKYPGPCPFFMYSELLEREKQA